MNLDFEELHVFDNSLSKYVPREMYEKAYRAWKQAAKEWRRIARGRLILPWKQAAKKWWQIFLEEKESRQHFQALADKRLELLRDLAAWYRDTTNVSFRFLPIDLVERLEEELGDEIS